MFRRTTINMQRQPL
ncbi:MAG: hypothetical protein QG651_699, partial [Pseudomonadota bacterium]|nr:hypothetical protein [Pseudomonadota bacterium]